MTDSSDESDGEDDVPVVEDYPIEPDVLVHKSPVKLSTEPKKIHSKTEGVKGKAQGQGEPSTSTRTSGRTPKPKQRFEPEDFTTKKSKKFAAKKKMDFQKSELEQEAKPDKNLAPQVHCLLNTTSPLEDQTEPSTIDEALRGREHKQWTAAIQKELNSLAEMDT